MARCCLSSREANCLRRCRRTSCFCSSYIPKHPNSIRREWDAIWTKTLSMQQYYLLFIRLIHFDFNKNYNWYLFLKNSLMQANKSSLKNRLVSKCLKNSIIGQSFKNHFELSYILLNMSIYLLVINYLLTFYYQYSIHVHIEIQMMK